MLERVEVVVHGSSPRIEPSIIAARSGRDKSSRSRLFE
jgi:hypothetical protein